MRTANSSMDFNRILIDKRIGSRDSGHIESFFQDQFGFDALIFGAADLEQNLFKPLLISRGEKLNYSQSSSFRTESNWFGKLLRSSLTINEVRVAKQHLCSGLESVAPSDGDYWGSVLGTRLMDGEKVIGAVVLLNASENAYGEEHISLLNAMIPFVEAFLQSELRDQQLEKNHVYTESIEKLLYCLDGSEEPGVFLELMHTVLSVYSNVVEIVLFEYKNLTDSYLPIAVSRDTDNPRGDFYYRLLKLLDGRNISASYVYSACAHASSPLSLFGDQLRELVIESEHREMFLAPLSHSTGARIGALVLAFNDCSSETYRRTESFNAMYSIASTYLLSRSLASFNVDGGGRKTINNESVGLTEQQNFALQGGGTVRLTHRDLDVLKLLASGASNVKIAEHLGLAEGTVKNRLVNIFKKLEVNNRIQAVNKISRLGLGSQLFKEEPK